MKPCGIHHQTPFHFICCIALRKIAKEQDSSSNSPHLKMGRGRKGGVIPAVHVHKEKFLNIKERASSVALQRKVTDPETPKRATAAEAENIA